MAGGGSGIWGVDDSRGALMLGLASLMREIVCVGESQCCNSGLFRWLGTPATTQTLHRFRAAMRNVDEATVAVSCSPVAVYHSPVPVCRSLVAVCHHEHESMLGSLCPQSWICSLFFSGDLNMLYPMDSPADSVLFGSLMGQLGTGMHSHVDETQDAWVECDEGAARSRLFGLQRF